MHQTGAAGAVWSMMVVVTWCCHQPPSPSQVGEQGPGAQPRCHGDGDGGDITGDTGLL